MSASYRAAIGPGNAARVELYHHRRTGRWLGTEPMLTRRPTYGTVVLTAGGAQHFAAGATQVLNMGGARHGKAATAVITAIDQEAGIITVDSLPPPPDAPR